jgi:excisionase family DNA binding protein
MVPKSTGPEWMSTVEAHELVGVTLRTLYRLIDEGHIPAYKFGRVIRLRRSDVEGYIEQARIKPGELRHLYPHEKDDT